jgi:hypothetical protein
MKGSHLPYLLVACWLLLCLAISDARKTFLVKLQHSTLLAPKVAAYDTSWKLLNIGNGKYTLVLDNQIQVDIGFDFVQKQGNYDDKPFSHWKLRNNLYFK